MEARMRTRDEIEDRVDMYERMKEEAEHDMRRAQTMGRTGDTSAARYQIRNINAILKELDWVLGEDSAKRSVARVLKSG